jgi:hypothetical protein
VSSDAREKQLERHVEEGREVVEDLVRSLRGSPGIDMMRGIVLADAQKWLDETRWVPR